MTKIQPDRRTLCTMGTMAATAMVLDKSSLERALASDRQEEMTMEKVYSIYWGHDGENAPMIEPLDGDFKKVFPAGYEFNRVTNSVVIDDMPRLRKKWGYQCVPVDLIHVPKKVLFKSNGYPLPDILQRSNWFIVSDKFRQVVEGLEPDKHQFSAVELVDEVGAHVSDYFWFNPCVRIDSVNRDHTTHTLTDVGLSDYINGGEYIFDLSQIDNRHMWVDPRLSPGSVFISRKIKSAFEKADLEGLGHSDFDAVSRQ